MSNWIDSYVPDKTVAAKAKLLAILRDAETNEPRDVFVARIAEEVHDAE